ncbi:hypothetical protein ACNQUF_11980, partial [Corynebacterium diphtheriae]
MGTLDAVREANQGGKDVKVIWPDSDGYESTKDGNHPLLRRGRHRGGLLRQRPEAHLRHGAGGVPGRL